MPPKQVTTGNWWESLVKVASERLNSVTYEVVSMRSGVNMSLATSLMGAESRSVESLMVCWGNGSGVGEEGWLHHEAEAVSAPWGDGGVFRGIVGRCGLCLTSMRGGASAGLKVEPSLVTVSSTLADCLCGVIHVDGRLGP